MKSVKDMTAEEYKTFLLNSPDEAKKLDEPRATPMGPTGYWRNGTWVSIQPSQPE